MGDSDSVPDTIELDREEAKRIASELEMLYYKNKESAYDNTDEQPARDAMMIRDRAGVGVDPDILEDD